MLIPSLLLTDAFGMWQHMEGPVGFLRNHCLPAIVADLHNVRANTAASGWYNILSNSILWIRSRGVSSSSFSLVRIQGRHFSKRGMAVGWAVVRLRGHCRKVNVDIEASGSFSLWRASSARPHSSGQFFFISSSMKIFRDLDEILYQPPFSCGLPFRLLIALGAVIYQLIRRSNIKIMYATAHSYNLPFRRQLRSCIRCTMWIPPFTCRQVWTSRQKRYGCDSSKGSMDGRAGLNWILSLTQHREFVRVTPPLPVELIMCSVIPLDRFSNRFPRLSKFVQKFTTLSYSAVPRFTISVMWSSCSFLCHRSRASLSKHWSDWSASSTPLFYHRLHPKLRDSHFKAGVVPGSFRINIATKSGDSLSYLA